MPFLRIVRDKRGYEYFSLVHQTSGRRGKVRQQVLYWFRTPPNIKVGRQPLDEDVMRALEAQNPDVQFDWDALRDTPPPLPSVEPWRERRRAERVARQVRDADEEVETPEVEPELAASEPPTATQQGPGDHIRAGSSASPALGGGIEQASLISPDRAVDSDSDIGPDNGSANGSGNGSAAGPDNGSDNGSDNGPDNGSDDGPTLGPAIPAPGGAAPVAARRRRHRRRGRRGPTEGAAAASSAAAVPAEESSPSSTEHDQPGSDDEE